MVSSGAVLGANIRFILYEKFERLYLNKYLSTLAINTVASFFLGLFLSILTRIDSYNLSFKLILFFSIGLLGSLSTFSTFVYDLFDLIVKLEFFRALRIFFSSLVLGIISLAFGIWLFSR